MERPISENEADFLSNDRSKPKIIQQNKKYIKYYKTSFLFFSWRKE